LISAISAVDSIHASPGPDTSNDTYKTYITAAWENAIVASQKTYQLETRWVDYRFWQRRHLPSFGQAAMAPSPAEVSRFCDDCRIEAATRACADAARLYRSRILLTQPHRFRARPSIRL
jgi:hypothetical protein